jgi:hypothetical protein
MIRIFSRLRANARERTSHRRYQRAWDRAVARAGSDSHLDEINAIFARRAG